MLTATGRRPFASGAKTLLVRGVACLTAGALATLALPGVALARFNSDTTSVPAAAHVITVDDDAVTANVAAGKAAWLRFVAPTSGYYAFSSSSEKDTYAALYKESGSGLSLITTDDDSADDGNFELVAELQANVAYYLACSYYASDVSGSYSVSVAPYDASDLSAYTVSTENVNLGTTPSADTLNLRVRAQFNSDIELKYGTDYQISGWYDSDDNKLEAAPTALGSYYVEVKGIGSYTGTKREYFAIVDFSDISNVYAYADDVMQGTALTADTLDLRVYPYDTDLDSEEDTPTLVYGTDYEISGWYDSYDNDEGQRVKLASPPTAVGGHYVEVKGIGSYHGTTRAYFEICSPYDLDTYSVSAKVSHVNGTLALTFLNRITDKSAKLTAGTDYKVTGWYDYYDDEGQKLAAAPSKAGEYQVRIEGAGTYSGTKYVYFEISEDLNSPISVPVPAAKPAAKKANTLKVAKKKVTVKKGKKKTVKVTKAQGKVTVKSSKKKVAKVSYSKKTGKITIKGKKKGKATVTVKAAGTSAYKSKSVKIKVTVK